VTAADLESEALLKSRLHAAFPDHGIVGEEGTDTARDAPFCWYVDPLDGTLNFSRRLPVWCVSLALFEGDTALVGVVHDPIRGETFHAARGAGAFCNGIRVHASEQTDPDQALVHITVDFNDQSRDEGLQDLQQLAPAVLRTRNIGSAALALAYVASGRLDAMLHRHAHAWDYGAGVLLVNEAGGAVSTMSGTPWVPAEESIAAGATGALREALLSLLRAQDAAALE
jgi:myo-inositol-1(or 4)-monophosphatase